MEAFLVSAGVVALAEIGDKTQLLAFVLAARYRRPAPIIAGILVSTLANHALAGALGRWLMLAIGPARLRWALAASFLAMGAWILVPDHLDADEAAPRQHFGVFGTTVVAFFLAEMGDKTQIATAAAALAWMFAEWLAKGKPSVLGIASGAVAGLVAITPASGFVDATGALVMINPAYTILSTCSNSRLSVQ